MKNITDQEVVLEVGERVVQAVFAPFLIADGDAADGVRLVDLDRQGTRMKIIFVRHGEPDYSMLDKLENPQLYSGFGRDLAPLTGKRLQSGKRSC